MNPRLESHLQVPPISLIKCNAELHSHKNAPFVPLLINPLVASHWHPLIISPTIFVSQIHTPLKSATKALAGSQPHVNPPRIVLTNPELESQIQPVPSLLEIKCLVISQIQSNRPATILFVYPKSALHSHNPLPTF